MLAVSNLNDVDVYFVGSLGLWLRFALESSADIFILDGLPLRVLSSLLEGVDDVVFPSHVWSTLPIFARMVILWTQV